MLKYLLFILLLVGCNSNPPCPLPTEKDTLGIFSKEIGHVVVNGESCSIIETYRNYRCPAEIIDQTFASCSGYDPRCASTTLTRITKCPSFSSENSITHSPDKYHREIIQ